MTAYINSVQHVVITIASGASTGTASISAITGTAFLVFQGNSTTATTSNADAFCRVSLSGTTVTATRGGTGANTCTVHCDVVDATSSLVKSVQMGSLTTTTASATTTITAVTNANTAVHILGTSQTLASYHYDLNTMRLSLSGTTLTATNINGASGTTIVGWLVLEFQGAALNQAVQTFAKAWTNTTGSTTQALTSVNVANAMVFFAGGGSTNGDTAADEQPEVFLTSGTTATVSCGNASSGNAQIADFSVVEFVSGVLSQTAQRGTIALTGASSNTATLTSAATANTLLNMTGWKSSASAVTTAATIRPTLTLTSSTVATASTASSATTTTVGYEALTFTAGGGGGSTNVFRKTFSSLGTRIGSRQAMAV